jgi:hypothetical protein
VNPLPAIAQFSIHNFSSKRSVQPSIPQQVLALNELGPPPWRRPDLSAAALDFYF